MKHKRTRTSSVCSTGTSETSRKSRKHSSCESSDEIEIKARKEKSKRQKKHKSKNFETSDDERRNKREKKKKHKKSKKEKKSNKNDLDSMKNETDEECLNVPVALMHKSKFLAPMTKEEWEKQQNIVRRVYDEATGRHRLIKGDGEVIEEIVSKDRHHAINRQATVGDGNYFQAQLHK